MRPVIAAAQDDYYNMAAQALKKMVLRPEDSLPAGPHGASRQVRATK
jgi:hypothetical protein